MVVSENKKMVSLRADECQRICLAETLPDPLWDTLKKIFEDTGKNTKLIWHMFTVDTFYWLEFLPIIHPASILMK